MSHPSADAEYDDQYPTCVETYSTLRIFSDQVGPERITSVLAIQPTQAFHKGEAHGTKGLHRKANGWLLCTEEASKSKDTRKHIDIILQALSERVQAVDLLRSENCKLDICSYWVSAGQGGPSLWPHQMTKLGELGIEVWWDVYFQNEDET